MGVDQLHDAVDNHAESTADKHVVLKDNCPLQFVAQFRGCGFVV